MLSVSSSASYSPATPSGDTVTIHQDLVPPVGLDNGLQLLNDTGTSSTDQITSDPRVTGIVSGDFCGDSVVVQFNDNGNATGSTQQITATSSFIYDPRQDDASLSGYTGPYDVQYRFLIYDSSGKLVYSAPWSDFNITIVAPETEPYVADFGLVNDTGPAGTPPSTYDPRVGGTLKGDLAGGSVDVQFDLTGNGTPSGTVADITASGTYFNYDPLLDEPSLAGFAGLLPLSYRVVDYDSQGNVVFTGSLGRLPDQSLRRNADGHGEQRSPAPRHRRRKYFRSAHRRRSRRNANFGHRRFAILESRRRSGGQRRLGRCCAANVHL